MSTVHFPPDMYLGGIKYIPLLTNAYQMDSPLKVQQNGIVLLNQISKAHFYGHYKTILFVFLKNLLCYEIQIKKKFSK